MGLNSFAIRGLGVVMDWLIVYFLLGIVLTEAMEWLNRVLKQPQNRLGVGSYIAVMLLWPLFLLIFVRGCMR